MNRLLLILIIVFSIAIPYSWSGYDLVTYQYPPFLNDSDGVYTYRCYSSYRNIYPTPIVPMYLYPNHQCSILYERPNKEYIGEWRVFGDTILIYETWSKENPDLPRIIDSIDSVRPDYPLTKYFMAPKYRKLIEPNFTNEDEYPYAANVSAYKIINYGETLIPVESALNGRLLGCFAEPADYIPDSIVRSEEWIPVCSAWEKKRVSWRKGTYEVIEVTRGLRSVATVTLRKGDVDYTIVKPTSYLPGREPLLYDKADEEALCAWMDTVQVGRRYRFELQRPDYPADSLQHVPYLRTTGRSLYVSKLGRPNQAFRQAYGYFFAKLVKP